MLVKINLSLSAAAISAVVPVVEAVLIDLIQLLSKVVAELVLLGIEFLAPVVDAGKRFILIKPLDNVCTNLLGEELVVLSINE